MPLIIWEFLINHLNAVPISLLSVKSDKEFLRYGPKGGQDTAAAMEM